MSRTYRGYFRILSGDDGKPLGAKGLEPIVVNLNAHARARAEDKQPDWPLRYDPFRVASHLGKAVILMECEHAWDVRVAYPAARTWLNATGWRWTTDLNANTFKAL